MIGGCAKREVPLAPESVGGRYVHRLVAIAETTPVETSGDAADDPALWYDALDPSRSLILGTNKRKGLQVCTLSGTEVQFLSVGRLNNVDVRTRVNIGKWADGRGELLDLVAASHRDERGISLFAVERRPEGGRLRELAGSPIRTGLAEPYGLCMMQHSDRSVHVFVGDKSGRIEEWRIGEAGGIMTGALVRTITLESQVEGMVADEDNNVLFVGEEARGVWAIDLSSDLLERKLVLPVGEHLKADVEGLALINLWGNGHRTGERWLIASSQGNQTFVVCRAEAPYAVQGLFAVVPGLLGGAEYTDGIEVFSMPLSAELPYGVFIAQDGASLEGNQNFKIVPWHEIEEAINGKPRPEPESGILFGPSYGAGSELDLGREKPR